MILLGKGEKFEVSWGEENVVITVQYHRTTFTQSFMTQAIHSVDSLPAIIHGMLVTLKRMVNSNG